MGDGAGGMWGFEGKRWARSWQSGMERLHERKREKCFFFFHEPTVEVKTKLKTKKKKRNLKIRTNYLCLVFNYLTENKLGKIDLKIKPTFTFNYPPPHDKKTPACSVQLFKVVFVKRWDGSEKWVT